MASHAHGGVARLLGTTPRKPVLWAHRRRSHGGAASHAARRFSGRTDAEHMAAFRATLPAAYETSFEQFSPVWRAVCEVALAGAAVNNEPSTILDLASAHGEPACSLAQCFPRAQVVASDNEPSMVAAAVERGRRLGLGGRFSAQEADLNAIASLGALPPDETSVDLVSASLALHMLPPEAMPGCLGGIHTLLRPGGRLVAAVWEDELALLPLSRACLTEVLGRPLESLPALEPHSPLSLAAGRADALLRDAGFQPGPQHNTLLSFSLNLGPAGADSTWMLGLMPCLGALSNLADAGGVGGGGGVFDRAREAFERRTSAAVNGDGDVVVGPMRVRILAVVKPGAG